MSLELGAFVSALFYGTSRSSAHLPSFVRAEAGFEIKIQEPTELTEVFREFPQSLKTNAAIISQIKPQILPSTTSPIHYSLITQPFDATATDSVVK
jgi:hypothetical protein